MFEVHSSKKIYHANNIQHISDVQISNSLPYVVRTTTNNGLRGFIIEDETYANEGNTLSFAQDTFSVFYQKQKYFTGNKVKVLKGKFENQSEQVMSYLTVCFQKALSEFTWGVGSTVESIVETKIMLPVYDNKVNFDFMEAFIATLKAERLATLKAYLTVTGLTDTTLTASEETALARLNSLTWKTFRILDLFGKSSRGRRLKSADRIEGKLPFVTAGEANAGISAWIGNDVHIFSKNTVTIDMFGSAKYRGYDYGADDHVAVVHSEKWLPYAVLFLTACIHKSSHAGQFDYSRNFYASDADDLTIQLPITKEGTPDYDTMNLVVSALQKVVIQSVVSYLDDRIEKTGELV